MLATEIAKNGIKVRVNSIAPGVFPSEMTTDESGDNQKSNMPKEKKEGLPAGRPGKDTDMAAAIMFLTCCQYLNGQVSTVIVACVWTSADYVDCDCGWRVRHSGWKLEHRQETKVIVLIPTNVPPLEQPL